MACSSEEEAILDDGVVVVIVANEGRGCEVVGVEGASSQGCRPNCVQVAIFGAISPPLPALLLGIPEAMDGKEAPPVLEEATAGVCHG